MTLSQLWAALNQHGVSLTLTAEGKLRPSAAQPPPPELVEAMREHKAALLEELQNDTRTIPEPVSTPSKRPRPDPITAGQQPGHCGCCARWVAHPAPAAHLGVCDAGRRAHGWLDGAPLAPVETQAALLCQVYGGSGWRALHHAEGTPLERPA